MLVHLTDMADNSVKGVLDTPDTFTAQNLLRGGQDNFRIAKALCSDDPEKIFDLSPPPSFSDDPMIWGELDKNGTLHLFLAETTGDRSFPFAELKDFRASLELFIQGRDSQGGGGTLTRSNILPPDITWALSP